MESEFDIGNKIYIHIHIQISKKKTNMNMVSTNFLSIYIPDHDNVLQLQALGSEAGLSSE